MKRKKYKNTRAEKICIITLMAPAIIHLLVFWLGVQIETLGLAFTNAYTNEFTLDNFALAISELFGGTAATNMMLNLRNTMIFFVIGLLKVPFSIFVAYLIWRRCFGATFSRLGLYLPAAIGGIMLTIMYAKMMSSDGPLIHLIQNMTGAEGTYIFKVEHPLLYIILYDTFVGLGGSLIIWLGSMGRIPDDLIEYGKLEGITPIQEFVKVILPLIWPTFVTMITLQIIGMFGSSGSVMLLTDGQYGTSTIAFWMYQVVRDSQTDQYNYITALGLVFTILTLPLVYFGRKFMNKYGSEVEY